MDNVTHTFAGLVLAQSAVRLRARRSGGEPSAAFGAVAALSSTVAANLPDADLFYTGVGGNRIMYMLHHRGHTHTVVVAILGALLLWGVTWLVFRWRARGAATTADARWLFALLMVSTLSHLLLDWTNSYGVHPFWPFDNRWRYGDAVFIVEPWFWVVSAPMLVAASRNRLARALLSIVLVMGLVLAWRVDLVAKPAATALTAGALLFVVLAGVLRPDTRAIVAISGWIVVTLLMATGSSLARRTTALALRAADPAATIADVVVTPLPANPVCTSVITVEVAGGTYRVATARVSAVPSLVDASHCGMRSGAGPMFRASARPSMRAIDWESEWTAPREELSALARESCPALAALRFIRVPAWRVVNDSTVMLGDVRYGGGSGSGFSDVAVPRRSPRCPRAVPPWTPPRADVLGH
jgi:inner membrane protein